MRWHFGYQVALHQLRTSEELPLVDRKKLGIPLEHLVFCCLFLHRRSLQPPPLTKLSDINWNEAVDTLRPAVVDLIGVIDDELTIRTGETFKAIYDTWGKHIMECREAIPNRWFPEVGA
jgi:hypothetical protein